MKYDDAKQAMIGAADMKLIMNAYKGPIETLSIEASANLAKKEIDELLLAAKDKNWEHVILEAGDVFNFIMGIVFVAMQQYERRKDVK